jgi:hypothetical protein
MQAKMAQIQVELKRIDTNQETEGAKLAMQAHSSKQQQSHQHETVGFQSGLDLHKHGAQLTHQAEMARQQREAQATQQAGQAEKPAKESK